MSWNMYAPPAAPRVVGAGGYVPPTGECCQLCGRGAATKRVTLMRNIGVVVLRFPRTITGSLCRHCIDKYFWEYTTVSFFLGWWGVISFFTTMFAIPANLVAYFGSRSLPAPPEDEASIADKRTRSVWMMVVGGVGAFLALAWVGLMALAVLGSLADGDDDVGGIIVALGLGLVAGLAPAILMFVVGIQTRLRANTATV